MDEKKLFNEDLWIKNHTVCNHSGVAVQGIFEKVDGKIQKTGEHNLQDEANAAAVGCGVYGIIDRLTRGAHVDVAPADSLLYGDCTGLSEATTSDALAHAQAKLAEAVKHSEEVSQSVDDKLAKALEEINLLKEALSKKDEDK